MKKSTGFHHITEILGRLSYFSEVFIDIASILWRPFFTLRSDLGEKFDNSHSSRSHTMQCAQKKWHARITGFSKTKEKAVTAIEVKGVGHLTCQIACIPAIDLKFDRCTSSFMCGALCGHSKNMTLESLSHSQ